MTRWRNRVIYPRRGDLLAIGLIGGIGVLAAAGQWGLAGWAWLPNFGFGSDWHCTYPGKGQPICVKQPDNSATH
jgi:hypothetical protein